MVKAAGLPGALSVCFLVCAFEITSLHITLRSGLTTRLRARREEGLLVKVRPSVKPICDKCKVIKRRGAVMVICEDPKHKQKQG